jgi:transposase InsO family protein
LIVDALGRLRGTLPFPIRGIDTDNGSEFINELLMTFCSDHGIEFTRSRPYRKNDQAWVEQKNGSVVRRLSLATDDWKVSRQARRCRGSTRPHVCS